MSDTSKSTRLGRRAFLAGGAALAGTSFLGPRPLSALEVEQAFIGGMIRHPEMIARYLDLPGTAFDDVQLRHLWGILRNLVLSKNMDVGWTPVGLRRFTCIGGDEFYAHLSDVAAPADRIPDLARRLDAIAEPQRRKARELIAAALRRGDLRPGSECDAVGVDHTSRFVWDKSHRSKYIRVEHPGPPTR